jgi:hypothetical protein
MLASLLFCCLVCLFLSMKQVWDMVARLSKILAACRGRLSGGRGRATDGPVAGRRSHRSKRGAAAAKQIPGQLFLENFLSRFFPWTSVLWGLKRLGRRWLVRDDQGPFGRGTGQFRAPET